ncbi:unnamed protein product [Polarella glacialis]|uniref:Uncharacterized protein n=1 Tax=Polarella glacialis TaxID=89957 RepID=A0A813EJA3_POLGL|nr:unnamed protein product [Polarella glacialis]CAE8631279.1 unnamed protein product [Polarella glacialis]
MAAAMELLLPGYDGKFNTDLEKRSGEQKEWAEVLLDEDDDSEELEAPVGRGQVRQLTFEVQQDEADATLFRVDGKDKSWFLQKGAVVFNRPSESRFRLEVTFQAGLSSRFGDEYAELSRAEQSSTINWLLMAGIARGGSELTGYRDCKTSGFYFLFHLNYRRTRWRIIACPHTAELEDTAGKLYTGNPQDADQFELPAYEGQILSVEYADGELWLLEAGLRRVRGIWAYNEAVPEGKLPAGDYYPTVLTSNCPTAFHARVV